VVPLGVVSIYFIIIQPIVIGTYCSLCPLAALAMLVMMPFTLDELVAMGQDLMQVYRRGESVLRAFFMGGASPGSGRNNKPNYGASWPAMTLSAARGMTVRWTLVASALDHRGTASPRRPLTFGRTFRIEEIMPKTNRILFGAVTVLSLSPFVGFAQRPRTRSNVVTRGGAPI
jgi:hypothetical protein